MEGIDLYHFLSSAFTQRASILAKVINFYHFDVGTRCDKNFTIEYCCAWWASRISGALLKLANVKYRRNFLPECIVNHRDLLRPHYNPCVSIRIC